MPRFLMTSIASILLAACGADTMEVMPSQTEEVVEPIQNERISELPTNTVAEIETESKPIEPTSNQVEESVVVEEVNKAETITNEFLVKNKERALNRLLTATHLDREGYTYFFTETDADEYIQMEVRKIQEDSEHASLEGAYRYVIKTEEILMRDYLTGDFIAYVEPE